jgi:hypothetical protein
MRILESEGALRTHATGLGVAPLSPQPRCLLRKVRVALATGKQASYHARQS